MCPRSHTPVGQRPMAVLITRLGDWAAYVWGWVDVYASWAKQSRWGQDTLHTSDGASVYETGSPPLGLSPGHCSPATPDT